MPRETRKWKTRRPRGEKYEQVGSRDDEVSMGCGRLYGAQLICACGLLGHVAPSNIKPPEVGLGTALAPHPRM